MSKKITEMLEGGRELSMVFLASKTKREHKVGYSNGSQTPGLETYSYF